MKCAQLLHGRRNSSAAGRLRVVETVPRPTEPLRHLEFDIKYMYVHGLKRNALMLTVIDVLSRFNVGWIVQLSVRKNDVTQLFGRIVDQLPTLESITVRSDNGSQFVSKLLREFFEERDITHEFIKPATPDENAHIESYHSIVQRAVCDRFEFDCMEHLITTIARWVEFYNFDRIHCGIDGLTPNDVLRKFGLTMRSTTLPTSMTYSPIFQTIN